MGLRLGQQKVAASYHRKIAPVLQTVAGGIILPIFIGLIISFTIFEKYERDVSTEIKSFGYQESRKSQEIAEKLTKDASEIQLGMRALASLPEFTSKDKVGYTLVEDASKRIIRRVLDEFQSKFGVNHIYVSSIDMLPGWRDPSTKKFWSFSLSFSKNAQPERYIIRRQVKVVREQLDFLQQRFPYLADINPLEYPSTISGPVTIESISNPTRTVEKPGVLYSVPLYGKSKEMIGAISCALPEGFFVGNLQDENTALVNLFDRSIFTVGTQGLVASNLDHVRNGSTLESVIFSETRRLNLRDQSGYWILWKASPDEVFVASPGHQVIQRQFWQNLIGIWVIVGLTIFLIRHSRTRQERRFQSMVRNSHEVILVVDGHGMTQHVIGQSQSQLGWKTVELENLDFGLFVHEESVDTLRNLLAKVDSNPYSTESVEIRVEHKESGFPWFEATASNMKHFPEVGDIVLTLRNIESRKNSEVMLRAAKEAAESANNAKTEFLSRMSHELRTPLNAILGFGQLLEMSELEKRDMESVEQILKAGRHLLDVVNDILDIARIETHNLSMSVEPQKCDEIMLESINLVQTMANSRGIRLEFETPDDLGVYADRQRLKQVLINLLSNAIKYNRPNGTVKVYARMSASHVRIHVEDTGIGIPLQMQRRMFTPFDRLGADRSSVEGVGLGLSLCKSLVEAMNGRIEVVSTEGSGSTFTVVLPFAEVRAEDALLGIRSVGVSPIRQRKVLYIEDNLSNLRLVKDIFLRRNGFDLITAEQGGIGIEMAETHRPDLILLDLDLPDLNGLDVLKHLRGRAEFEAMPIIVMTADATESKRRNVLQAGATAYLSKPIDIAEFLRVLEHHHSHYDLSQGESSEDLNSEDQLESQDDLMQEAA